MRRSFLPLVFVFSALFFSCGEIFPDDESESEETAVDASKVVTSASFAEASVTLAVGEVRHVVFNVSPSTAVASAEVTYAFSDTDSQVASLSGQSSNGLILTGLKAGNAVLVAKCSSFTSYLNVIVSGVFDTEPCISVSSPVTELKVGERRSLSFSLYGGSQVDSSLFEYASGNSDVLSVSGVGSVCVVEALRPGFSRVTVSHPKAKYPASALVYCIREGEKPCYITTDQNVVQLTMTGGTRQVTCSLVGSEYNDLSLFTFEAVEGSSCVDLLYNNNVCSITPVSPGVALIRASHPDSAVPLEFQAVVVSTSTDPYLACDSYVNVLSLSDSIQVNLSPVNLSSPLDYSKIEWTVSDDDVIKCVRVNSSFYVTALSQGRSTLRVTHPSFSVPLDIYFVVGWSGTVLGGYVTTSQNVIRLEVGDESDLSMLLVGGNESDSNGFSWVVSDPSVVSLDTPYGTVSSRAAVSDAAEDVFSAVGVVKALSVGFSNISVSHPKASSSASVQVRVYAKGALEGVNRARLKGSGIVKVLKGSSVEYTVEQESGDDKVTNPVWSSDDEGVFTVRGAGLSALVTGVSRGSSYLRVKDSLLYSDYTALVVCGETQAELDSARYIYSDRRDIELYKGQTSWFEISSTVPLNDSWRATVSDSKVAKVSMSQDVLVISALAAGTAQVVVSHPDSENELVLFLTVIDEVTIDKPYSFSYEKFLGVVVGETVDYSLELPGSSPDNSSLTQWTVADPSVVSVTGNSLSARVTANRVGETVMTAENPRAASPARVVVYTASTAEELAQKVVLSCGKYNYLSYVGGEIYVSVDVTDSENNREKIEWSCDDISVCKVDSNYDSAFIRCLSSGSCVVTVSCPGANPVRIYVSVKETEEELYEKDIVVPSVIQALTGSSRVIEAVVTGLTKDELSQVEWSSSDFSVVEVAGSGDTCYVSCKKAGYCEVMVRLLSCAIERKVQFVVADTYEELDSSVVIGLPRSYYTMDVGGLLELELEYGTLRPSDEVEAFISWISSDSSLVSVQANGRRASLRGLSEGIAVVNVSGNGILNTLSFRVAVGDVPEDYYYISLDKMVGIVVGDTSVVTASLCDSSGEEVSASLDEFSFSLTDGGDEVVRVNQADNVFQLTALSAGECYMEVSHPLAKSARVYVYTASTAEELESFYPLSADKTSWLLSVGDSAVLSVNTIDDSKVSDIKWSCSNGSVCAYNPGSTKKSLSVIAKKAGTCVFTARHPDAREDVVFTVYVSEFSPLSGSVTMQTEGIVSVLKGSTVETWVQTNMDESLVSSLVWSSSNEAVCAVEGTGKRALISGVSKGVCEVTVRYSSTLYRTLVVYVGETDAELSSFACQNIDRRYSVIRVGDTLSLLPYYARVAARASDVVYEDVYGNGVVSHEVQDGRLIVRGVVEGIACFKVSNPGCLNSYKIFVEVNEKAEAVVSESSELGYLSAVKMAYVLSASDTLTAVEAVVTPVGIDSSLYPSIVWESLDESVCQAYGNGVSAKIFANSSGETSVRVSSPYSSNVLLLRVVVLAEGGEVPFVPYITGDVASHEVKVGETLSLEFTVSGGDGVYPVTGFSAVSSDDNVILSMAGNVLKVRGANQGQSVVTVSYDDSSVSSVSFVVSVVGVADNIVYLTTGDNYSVITEGSYRTLSVSLSGYEEVNGNNFDWEVVSSLPDDGSSSSVVSVAGSGPTRLCTALVPGTARIKVTHHNGDMSALYPIYLTVKVTDYEEVNPVYIKTDTNVLTVTEGGRQTVSVELMNGSESSYSLFQWSTSTPDVLRLSGAGRQCVVQALQAGIGRIQVSHPDSVGGAMDMVVVVEAEDEGDPLYISGETLVEMSPNDAYKQLSVSLVGGTPEQNTLFSWEIVSFESVVKNKDGTSNAVISMSGSQTSAIVRPVREGVAVVRVTNSATRHYLDIKVMVTLYQTLSFKKSYLNLKELEVGMVDVEVPTGKTVVYESSDERVAVVSGTSKKCVVEGVSKGTCVVMARTSDGSSSAELMVSVEKDTDVVSKYITLSSSTLTLNTTDDAKGVTMRATLNGTGVGESDQDNITWTLSESGVASFAGAAGLSVTGPSVVVRPVSQGDVSVVVSHPDAKNSRTLYVAVEQDSASLVVSSTYETTAPGEITPLSCTLSGVAESAFDDIVWSVSDSSVIKFAGNDVLSDGTVRGLSCQVLSRESGGAKVTCSYGNITRTVSFFVQERPSLVIPNGMVRVGPDQTMKYKVEFSPPEYGDRIHVTSSGMLYANVEGKLEEDGYYIYVTGGNLTGQTMVTVMMDDLSAKMTVVTVAEITARFVDYELYDQSGKITRVASPSNLRIPLSSKKVRLHYQTDPGDVEFDNEPGTYSMRQLVPPYFVGSGNDLAGKDFLYMSYGTEGSGYTGGSPRYVEIVPKCAGYATIRFSNADTGTEIELPVCFYDDTRTPAFTCTVYYGDKRSKFDEANGIITVVNHEELQFGFNMPVSSFKVDPNLTLEESKIQFTYDGNKLKGNYGTNPEIPSSNYSKRVKIEYAGRITLTGTYPDYCGNRQGEGKEYRKTYIVMLEEWK